MPRPTGSTGAGLRLLEDEIVERAWASGLGTECGLARGTTGREAIAQLDAQLCDIKELAVRDRLHVFGRAPDDAAVALLGDAIVAASGETEWSRADRTLDPGLRAGRA